MIKRYFILIGITLSMIQTIYTQVDQDTSLFIELKKMDSLVFQRGFNNCDLVTLKNIIHSDFEFYHDENGMQDKLVFMNAFKESICNNPDKKPIRELVDGSLEVYPLKNNGEIYGAIQKGVHLFYIKEPEKKLNLTNIAKFTSVWIIENDLWKLSRVLSYDHKAPNSD